MTLPVVYDENPLDACTGAWTDASIPADLPDELVVLLPTPSELLGDEVVVTLNKPDAAASWTGSGCENEATRKTWFLDAQLVGSSGADLSGRATLYEGERAGQQLVNVVFEVRVDGPSVLLTTAESIAGEAFEGVSIEVDASTEVDPPGAPRRFGFFVGGYRPGYSAVVEQGDAELVVPTR